MTINSVLAYIYCNVVIVMLCPKVMCNACALLVLCFDYIHSIIVKFVLNPKRINTTLNNFIYICNINACSKSTIALCIYGTESNKQACVDSEYNLQGTEDNI